MANYASKVVLVTGGSRGIGKDSALQLAKKGFDVITTYQTQKDSALEVIKEIQSIGRKAYTIQLDIANSSGFEVFVNELQQVLSKHFGGSKLDALVNNAGIGIYKSFHETSEAEIDTMVNIHFKGPFILTQKLLPLLNDAGSIVNISSALARFSFAGYSAYGPMKAAAESFTRYLALELGNRKIRVNAVAPGAIATDFGGGAVRDNSDFQQSLASQTALGRVGLPDDIGSVVAFLCTDDSKWINAQRLEISGGFMI